MAKYIVMYKEPGGNDFDPCVRIRSLPGVVLVRHFMNARNCMMLIDYEHDEKILQRKIQEMGPRWSAYPQRTYRISNG